MYIMKDCFIFDKIQPFYNNYACERINKKWGIIGNTGAWIIRPKFDFLSSTKNDWFIFKEDNKYGILDKAENIIIPAIFEKLNNFKHINYHNYLISVINGKFGVINFKGENIIPNEYEYISETSIYYLIAIKDGKYGRIDMNNNIIIPFEYDTEIEQGKDFIIAGKFNCIYRDNEVLTHILYGINDYNGNNVIPFEYKELKIFEDNMYLDEIYLSAATFCAKTKYDKYIVIEKGNKKICRQEFDEIMPEGGKYYCAKIGNQTCLTDKYGNIKFLSKDFENIYGFMDLNEDEYVAIVENENFEEALINQYGAYWFYNIVAIEIKPILEKDFYFIELLINKDETALITVKKDKGEPILYQKEIEYTDCPYSDEPYKFCFDCNSDENVICLLSEY